MSLDLGDTIGETVGRVAREAADTIATNGKKATNGQFSGPTGLAAGAGLAALAPLAVKGASKLMSRGGGNGAGPVKKARQAVGGKTREKVVGTVKDAVDESGGVGGALKQAGKGMLPGVGGKSSGESSGEGGGSGSEEAVPKGRRMPVQQSVDVAVPLKEAYNAWTQFEDWSQFMHRLDRVSQEDDSHVSFKTKMWGFSREFTAEIVEQRPDDRIKWRVTEGVTHTGVVSFHEISDRLTRVDVDISVNPGSLIEKAARGMRHVKRAVRADLARFKAYVEIGDEESGDWRGTIEDGEVKSKGKAQAASSRSRSRSASGSRGRSSSGKSAGRSSSGKSAGRSSSGKSTGRSSSGKSTGRSSSAKSQSGNRRSTSSRAKASSSGRSSSGRSSSKSKRQSASSRS
jgi:uncharacterized membrane protein